MCREEVAVPHAPRDEALSERALDYREVRVPPSRRYQPLLDWFCRTFAAEVLFVFCLAAGSVFGAVALAQEMEPRAFSPSPVGTNFAGVMLSYSSGDVSVDPTLPIENISAEIETVAPGYSRVFALAGHAVSIGAALPVVHARVSGDIGEDRREVIRDGLGDARFRVSSNIVGGEALRPEEFRERAPHFTAGASLVVAAPTGDYNSQHLVNLGTNRWAMKPEVGVSYLFDSWFIDASAGVWLFTDNHDFFGGQKRQQAPLETFQAHCGYTFMPGLWLAADGTFYTGGETTIAGEQQNDLQRNSRYGATLSIPLSPQFSLKVAASRGLSTRIGGDFSTLLAGLQYRWFDP